MSRSTRITFLAHASVRKPRDAGFPGDEPLAEEGHCWVPETLAHLGHVNTCLVGPELRTRQTASALGLDCGVDQALRDLDVGHWVGLPLAEISRSDPTGLADFVSLPDATPHGGESLTALVARVTAWLEAKKGIGGHLLAITHPTVMRAALVAALGAQPEAFWRVEIEPLSQLALSGDGRRWTLRALSPPPG